MYIHGENGPVLKCENCYYWTPTGDDKEGKCISLPGVIYTTPDEVLREVYTPATFLCRNHCYTVRVPPNA